MTYFLFQGSCNSWIGGFLIGLEANCKGLLFLLPASCLGLCFHKGNAGCAVLSHLTQRKEASLPGAPLLSSLFLPVRCALVFEMNKNEVILGPQESTL